MKPTRRGLLAGILGTIGTMFSCKACAGAGHREHRLMLKRVPVKKRPAGEDGLGDAVFGPTAPSWICPVHGGITETVAITAGEGEHKQTRIFCPACIVEAHARLAASFAE